MTMLVEGSIGQLTEAELAWPGGAVQAACKYDGEVLHIGFIAVPPRRVLRTPLRATFGGAPILVEAIIIDPAPVGPETRGLRTITLTARLGGAAQP